MRILSPSQIHEASELLKRGGVVAFPTETVYGLGASIFLPEAIQRIFQVKGRPQDNPLIAHISDFHQLPLIVKEVQENFFLLADSFFPGPLTILLPKHENVPMIVSAHLPTIGVRMPAHPLARQLIEAVGTPLVAPSANLSGKPSSTTARHVVEDFGSTIDAVLDGGACRFGIESTVISLHPQPVILRPGAISQQQIEAVLKREVHYAEEKSEKPLSPGMKYRHYAPRARVRLFYQEEELELALTHICKRVIVRSLKSEQLYARFREADADGMDEIVILCDTTTQNNKALMNRLERAANG